MVGSLVSCTTSDNLVSAEPRCSFVVSGTQRTWIVGASRPVVNHNTIRVSSQAEHVASNAMAGVRSGVLDAWFFAMKEAVLVHKSSL